MKYHPHGSVLFCTFSVEEGLLLLAYLYSDPAKDNLETSIDRYPGLFTWEMFQLGQLTRHWKRVSRPQFIPIPRDAHNLRGYTKLAEGILKGDPPDKSPGTDTLC